MTEPDKVVRSPPCRPLPPDCLEIDPAVAEPSPLPTTPLQFLAAWVGELAGYEMVRQAEAVRLRVEPVVRARVKVAA